MSDSTTRRDDAIATTEAAEQERGTSADADKSAARLFDIRRIIGGLFVLYGVVVLIAGLVDGEAAKQKAAGIDINIWTGLGMLLLGLFFLIWMWMNPVDPPTPRREESGPLGR